MSHFTAVLLPLCTLLGVFVGAWLVYRSRVGKSPLPTLPARMTETPQPREAGPRKELRV